MEIQPRGNEFLSMFTLHRFFSRVFFVFPIIVIPVATYLASNWWFLFGFLFYLVGAALPKYLVLPLIAGMIFILIATHFDFTRNFTFFLLSMIIGSILYQIPQKYARGLEDVKEKIKKDIEEKLHEQFPDPNLKK